MTNTYDLGPTEAVECGLFRGGKRTQRIFLPTGHAAPRSSIYDDVDAASVHHSPYYGYAYAT